MHRARSRATSTPCTERRYPTRWRQAERSMSSSASMSAGRAPCTTACCTRRSAPTPTRSYTTSTARCSCRRTGCSTKSGSSSAAMTCGHSILGGVVPRSSYAKTRGTASRAPSPPSMGHRSSSFPPPLRRGAPGRATMGSPGRRRVARWDRLVREHRRRAWRVPVVCQPRGHRGRQGVLGELDAGRPRRRRAAPGPPVRGVVAAGHRRPG